MSAREIIVDSFAGGGGASEGIRRALGCSPNVAINHDAEAMALHAANHPESEHWPENVWHVDPLEACRGRPVGLMWLSPDCTHFSKAKGGKPVKKKIRGLAWVAVRWAVAVRPRVIVLENVEEFQGWGPVLRATGKPCPVRKGQTFRAFCRKFRKLGYQVEHRELRACDYGAPTSRKRLFLVARCDGAPIRWPKPTHGKGTPLPWRTAAECIEWSIPCPSIFDRRKPLAENTLRRIGRGIRRFVIESPRPFIVPLRGTGPSHTSAHSVDKPLSTVTAGGTHHALVAPSLVTYYGAKREGDDRVADIAAPLPTQSTENRFALVAPTLIQTGYGEREGQAPRVPGLDKPLGTVVAGGQKHGLVAAFLARHYGGHEPPSASLFDPVPTVTSIDHHALVATYLQRDFGRSVGASMDEPAPVITGGGGGHLAEVRAFLCVYYGTDQNTGNLREPMPAVTGRDRFGLVTVAGAEYVIADIGMRMLAPRELYRAQGFEDSYCIDIEFRGKPLTKTAQVRMVGNSVCPPLACAIVRANVILDASQVAA